MKTKREIVYAIKRILATSRQQTIGLVTVCSLLFFFMVYTPQNEITNIPIEKYRHPTTATVVVGKTTTTTVKILFIFLQ